MKKILLTMLTLIFVAGIAGSVFASNDRLPETIVGQTTAEQNGVEYYGGFTGNEAVYNYTNDDFGYNPFADPPPNASGPTGQSAGKKLTPYLNLDGQLLLGNNDYVIIDPDSTMDNNSGNISYSIWMKPTDFTNPNRLYLSDQNRFAIGYADARYIRFDPAFNMTSSDGGAVVAPGSSGEGFASCRASYGSRDTWNFVSVTYNKTTGEMKNYLNGEFQKTCTFKTTVGGLFKPMRTDAGAVTIGGLPDFAYAAKGSYSEVKVYDKTLSDIEVKNDYNGAVNTTSLKSYWKLNDGTGTRVKDSASTNDGDIINVADPATATSGWHTEDAPFAASAKGETGYDLFGFNQDSLSGDTGGCVVDSVFYAPTNRCFFSNSKNNNVKVLSSRTYVNSDTLKRAVTEIAAVYYPPAATLVGDAYLSGSALTDFAYWGRNLTQSRSAIEGTDTFWGLKSYTNNSNAQASLPNSLATESAEFKQYKAKVDELKGEADDTITVANLIGDIYLQSDNINQPPTQATIEKYPNGKVWYISGVAGNITINNSFRFHGIGTIIFGNNVTLNAGKTITTTATQADINSKLGIIALGDFRISGNNTVQASIFSLDYNYTNNVTITFSGNNVDMIGSFVSRYININGKSNIRFYYDKRLDSGWPPGFRYLNMPRPTEN